LEPWLKIDTWHTSHPLDEQRFHRALATAFREVGTPISFEDFKDAMTQLSRQYHPSLKAEFSQSQIEESAQTAENISLFVYNTAGI
jgi:hypothetical protein